MGLRGYTGYYNGIYLRSALEFAFVYYLDHKNIGWKYEEKVYHLKEFSYKPDFHLYNKNGDLIEIVEIKSETNREIGDKKINNLLAELSLPAKVLSYRDLLKIYQNEMSISLSASMKIWIEEYGAILNDVDNFGENNPMYGLKHKESTKILISKKAKERCKDPNYRYRISKGLIEYNRNTNFACSRKQRSKRIIKTCRQCNSGFEVTTSSKRKFCSQQCSSGFNSILGANRVKENSLSNHKKVKKFVEDWSKRNKDLVLKTKLNQITTNLESLFQQIEKLYSIKDLRIISKAIFGEDRGRKQLLIYLKSIVT